MTQPNYSEIATQYARDVIAGKISSAKLTATACQRHINDLAREDFEYVFLPLKANHPCSFIEKLPHIKGKWAGEKIKLEAWQIFIVCSAFGWVSKATGKRRFRTVYVEVPRKNAKALAINTLIPTSKGFKKIIDVHPGDVVYGYDGAPCNVIAESPVFIGHDCYELTFSTGEKIVADAGHLWVTDSRLDRDRKKGRGGKNAGPKPSVKTTVEIFNSAKARNENNHRVAIAQSIKYDRKDFTISPYVLGAWLGDGNSAGARITCSYNDLYIIDKITACGEVTYEVKSSNLNSGLFAIGSDRSRDFATRSKSLQTRLKSIGVINNKHIPDLYLQGDESQRFLLLKGLMDTDGTCLKTGQCVFTNTNERLADNVMELVASLGLKPSKTTSRAMLYGKDCGAVFAIQFFAYSDTPVFTLDRKLNRQKQRPATITRTGFRQIVSVEKINSVPTKCLSVDSMDHQFLVGNSYIPTHNSTISSAIGLYMAFMDGEGGAEVYSAATTRDQAKIVFNAAQDMARKTPAFLARKGVSVMAHHIAQSKTASTFLPLSSEGGTLDGLNVHCGIIDELHAHKTRAVFDVIETGTGAREQSLLWLITTAGSNRAGVCYEQRTYLTKILSGVAVDESYFGIIYTCDDGDDWTLRDTWIKANPNFGVSVFEDDITRLCNKAMTMPSAQNNFLTKRLNVWVNADTSWMDMRAWDACANTELTIEDFEGDQCWVALDLASKTDMAALVALFRRDGKYYPFGKFYLPEETIESSGNSQYAGWDIQGLITTTPGNVIDFEFIERDLLELTSRFEVVSVPYDPHQATQFAVRMSQAGLPMVEVRPTVLNFSESMKELESLVLCKKLEHDGNPIMTWMISNIVCHYDQKDNIYPRKERPENKIDGVVALIMALNRALTVEEQISIYDTRGIVCV